MNKKGLFKYIKKVKKNVQKEISDQRNQHGVYGSGMAGEGYAGGYRDALNDLELLINDVMPARRNWWEFDDENN